MCLNSCECEGLEVCVTVRESLSVNMHVCQERGRVSCIPGMHVGGLVNQVTPLPHSVKSGKLIYPWSMTLLS